MKALLGYNYAEFIDDAVSESKGENVLVIACNMENLHIQSTLARSRVDYITSVEHCQVLEISNVKQLLVYVSKLEADKVRNVSVSKLHIWNSMSYESDLILSKLYKLDEVTIGEPNANQKTKLGRWCTTIISKE